MTHDIIPEVWLELSEAAEYLGVHFTTLRRWADAGQAPYIRTPGGRRRFSKVELAAFLAGMHRGNPALPATPGTPGHALAHASVTREPWYARLDDAQRAAFRTQGQGLMAVLMQYATRSNGGEVFLEEGRRVATHYGEACARAGLSLIETVQTFIRVRRGFMDPLYEAGTLAGAPDADTWRLYDRMNIFLDNMLLAMLQAFHNSEQTQISS